ncbi:MAG TPA: hypothetical protein VH914_02345 [Acidimicrobiia bacterium]|nr:hypothetical protein [Acidimicrobiia bacterium]
MPTDPFVAPDLDDRPRQQQNLPPGLGYPPARGWRPTRPGDRTAMEIGTATPEGALRGRPGPNVGYAYTLAGRVRERFQLAPHEHSEDAVSVVAEVAMKRAAAFGRAPVMPDVELAIQILGYDGTADSGFGSWRTRSVHDAAHHYPVRRALVDLVPDSLLRAGPSTDRAPEIAAWQQTVKSIDAAAH